MLSIFAKPLIAQKRTESVKRYNYRYSMDELKDRAKGQIAVRQKTESVAVAFNNHYEAAAVENAIINMSLIDEILKHKQQRVPVQ
jgi:uncharacterized protein YecE (DUF72 family)